uniref:hypothetical protein n=1 Tax=Agathobacter sp. TaxID=2021311 RepID=UPI00405728F0
TSRDKTRKYGNISKETFSWEITMTKHDSKIIEFMEKYKDLFIAMEMDIAHSQKKRSRHAPSSSYRLLFLIFQFLFPIFKRIRKISSIQIPVSSID